MKSIINYINENKIGCLFGVNNSKSGKYRFQLYEEKQYGHVYIKVDTVDELNEIDNYYKSINKFVVEEELKNEKSIFIQPRMMADKKQGYAFIYIDDPKDIKNDFKKLNKTITELNFNYDYWKKHNWPV